MEVNQIDVNAKSNITYLTPIYYQFQKVHHKHAIILSKRPKPTTKYLHNYPGTPNVLRGMTRVLVAILSTFKTYFIVVQINLLLKVE